MIGITSNLQFHKQILKCILTIMVMITAVNISSSIMVKAEVVSNSKGFNYNGTNADEGEPVSKLYWAGSTERTGLLFYIVRITVDGKTEILTENNVLGYGSSAPVAMKVLKDDEAVKQFNRATTTHYDTHFGEIVTTKLVLAPESNLVYPVEFNGENNTWYGNNEAVREWLFSEIEVEGYGSHKLWQELVYQGFGLETLKRICQRDDLTLVVEPISIQTAYATKIWGEEATTFILNEADKDYKFDSNSYKPVIDSSGKVVRILTTGKSASYYNNLYTEAYQNISTPTGGANWKWTNQALPYCMTLEREQLGIAGIGDEYPERKSGSTYYKKGNGYSISMLIDSISLDYIHSYNIDKNPDYPDKAEEPEDTSEKDTTGTHTIIKIYYNQVYDSETTYTYDYVSTHTQPNTTGNISIISEYEETGYALKKWAVTSNQRQLKSYESWDSTFSTANPKQNSPVFTDLQLAEDGNQQYLYILYSKVIPYTPPQVEPEDYEIIF